MHVLRQVWWYRANNNCGSPPSLPAPSVFCVVTTSVSLSLLSPVVFLCFPPRPLVCSLRCGGGGCLPLVPLFAAAIAVSPLRPSFFHWLFVLPLPPSHDGCGGGFLRRFAPPFSSFLPSIFLSPLPSSFLPFGLPFSRSLPPPPLLSAQWSPPSPSSVSKWRSGSADEKKEVSRRLS